MTTHFDPEAGTLRVRHGALAVLALLATEPTSPRLHDHDVAPRLAELRSAGLVGAQGVHPEAAPLAAAIAGASTAAELFARDHGRPRRARCWISGTLAVVGVASEDDPHTYDLMADVPARLPDLVGELVGLGAAPPPPVSGSRHLSAEAFDDLLAADSAITAEAVAAALGDDRRAGGGGGAGDEAHPGTGDDAYAAEDGTGDDAFAAALTDGLRGAAVRWRLVARPIGVDTPLIDMDVLDAGGAGLWMARRDGGLITITAVEPPDVRAELGRLAP